MKNRILPSGLLTAFVGAFFLLFSTLTIAGNSGHSVDKKADGKSRMEKLRANQMTGQVSVDDQLKVLQQLENFKSKGSTLNLNWIPMGPDNYAGITWTVLFDNRDAGSLTIYAGSVNGGIWRSENLGLTWHQMNIENDKVLKVSSLIQTSNGTLYAGTGVTYCNSADYLGTGLYRSDDGLNFYHVQGTTGHNWASIAKLAVDPRNNRIFAATNSGLLYSDNGNDWTQIRSGYCNDLAVGSDGTILTVVADSVYISRSGNVDNFVNLSTGLENALPKTGMGWTNLAIAPSDPTVIYASIASTTGRLMNLYRSLDKGLNWTVVFPGNNQIDPYGGRACSASTLAVFPQDPFQILVGGVNMWWGKQVNTTGYYNWEKMSFQDANLTDANELLQYLPGSHHAYVFRPGYPTHLAIASNGGVSTGIIGNDFITFQTSNKNYIVSRFNSVAHTIYNSWALGGAQNIGTQALGAFYPLSVNNPNDGMQVWKGDPTAGLLGTANEGGDGGSCEWSMITPKTIFMTRGGDTVRRQETKDLTYDNGFAMLIDNNTSPILPMRLWESFTFENTRDSVKYYNRTGKTIPADTIIAVPSNNGRFLFEYLTLAPISPEDSLMVPDPVASRFFIYGTQGTKTGVFMTKDALKFTQLPTWYQVFKIPSTDPDVLSDTISALSVSNDLNTVWLGTQGGRIYRISNLTFAYDQATADVSSPTCIVSNELFDNLPFKGRFISNIAINSNNPANLMVTLGNFGNTDYVFRTNNALDSLPVFTSAQGNLPEMPVLTGIIEMHGNNRAIIGTEYGVFGTDNFTAASPLWQAELSNMGDVPVTEIRQQTTNHYMVKNLGTIYAASFGRGLWMDTTYYTPLGINPIEPKPTSGCNLMVYPNPVTEKVNITYTLEQSGKVNIQISDLMGRNVSNASFGEKSSGKHTSVIDLKNLPAGTYILRLNNCFGKIVKL